MNKEDKEHCVGSSPTPQYHNKLEQEAKESQISDPGTELVSGTGDGVPARRRGSAQRTR